MVVMLVVIASLMLFKSIFLTVIGYTQDYSFVFLQVFCILPDLGLSVLVATPGTMDLFEPSQYALRPTQDDDDALPSHPEAR